MEKILEKLNQQDAKFDSLTSSISELAQAIARKEAHDHHIDEKLLDLKGRIDNHSNRIKTLEHIQSGDSARRELINWIVKPAVGLIGLGLVAAIIMGIKSGIGG